MGNIIRLDEHLANLIAAGEVVERPANVVKELTENSLDAHATHIEIELKEAGLEAIRITDNGTGMDKDDAEIAFERHATSKIRSEYDLFHIQSLGFRGEALPSIAAVAKVDLVTSLGGNEGYQVTFLAGKKVHAGAASARKGTAITVTKLFYNTPARLKYMKGPVSELATITELVDKFAIAHPEVAFSFSNNGKEILRTAGNGNVLEVLGAVYGYGVAKMMRPFRNRNRDYAIQGVIANPLVNRSAKNYITLIANGRAIRNPKLIASVIEAFDQRIPKGRFPIALVKIQCDPLLIDVNIHPTKQEIKFSEDAKLAGMVVETLREAIQAFSMIAVSDSGAYAKTETEDQTRIDFLTIQEEFPRQDDGSFVSGTPIAGADSRPKSLPLDATPKEPFPDMEYIGQYAGTYLIFQNAEGLFLVDQHAAAERIRYERYIQKMGDPHPAFFDLLLPFNLDFSNSEAGLIQAHLADLAAFGLNLTPSGTQSFFLHSVPAWFPSGLEEIYAETVIRLAVEGKNPTTAEVRDELAKLLACKHSIKANRFINADEVQTLMRDLSHCQNPFTCPHGRPVVIRLPLHDIEKWFKRVM
jgi:DNA mismatch repair protein MutL